mmetsp:Transcript_16727/g.25066  ORF Transcript_16727/g.25066 Transcript_16727/m.25066 type:complete len:259 (+) Transcript_16727:771-1547(+)
MTALTSAKSTFTNPVLMIISEIPTTPCLKISSATKNASVTGVLSGTILNSLSLLTTIKVSTCSLKVSIASSACFILFLPSNANGFVTTPTVKQPHSLATSARTGAAPLPVPPPIPAVIKTISAPSQICVISLTFSRAAFSPTEGIPPAPSPRVICLPMLRRLGARDLSRACESVLMAQNDTPSILVWIMRLTAFPPPPPTPRTLMTHGLPNPSSGIMTPESVFLFELYIANERLGVICSFEILAVVARVVGLVRLLIS